MFIPSAKSKISLIILLIIAIVLFLWSDKSLIKKEYYDEQKEAAEIWIQAQKIIAQFSKEQEIFIDEEFDQWKSYLIGEEHSEITTSEGYLADKQITLNPDFAALLVEEFINANLRKGDLIAVNCTGSFPALNIAVMSAAKSLELDLVMISSVGSSMYGANNPDFTWLDMESILIEKNIFPKSYRSIAVSLGGRSDIAKKLKRKKSSGVNLLRESIIRNDIELIEENYLSQNIQKKLETFKNASQKEIKLYVNIGGGISSLAIQKGDEYMTSKKYEIPPGIHKKISSFLPKKYVGRGTIFLLNNEGIPVIHLLDIEKYVIKYKLKNLKELKKSETFPNPGENKFVYFLQSTKIARIALIILVICVFAVIIFDKTQLKFNENEIIKD
ncbi:MAG: poly-gamma-glutamate system protein [Candidatus Cloacimonetes bacterium]|nr:poly-gamma-glutamate system protein [Candidatus Cloacimonadota bacterium]